MKTRYLLYPPLMGLFTAALMIFAVKAAGTSADWLTQNLFLPGRMLTASLFPLAANGNVNPLKYFVEFALNFIITWIFLLFVTYFLDKLAVTLYQLTKV